MTKVAESFYGGALERQMNPGCCVHKKVALVPNPPEDRHSSIPSRSYKNVLPLDLFFQLKSPYYVTLNKKPEKKDNSDIITYHN